MRQQVCESDSEDDGADIAGDLQNAAYFDSGGRVSFLDRLLQTAALLFTGDTGPLYIAEAVGTKTLSLWGPTMPEIYGPLTEGHVFLRSPYECVACCKTRCDRKNNGCMNALKPKVAAEMLRKFFATTTSSPGGTGTFLRNPFE